MRVRHQNDNVEEIVAATIEAMEAVKGKEIVTWICVKSPPP